MARHTQKGATSNPATTSSARTAWCFQQRSWLFSPQCRHGWN